MGRWLLEDTNAPVINDIRALKAENAALKTDYSNLKTEYDALRLRFEGFEARQFQRGISLEDQIIEAKIQANDVAQYSRRNNIRIYNLPEHDNENTKNYVWNTTRSVLNLSSDFFPLSVIDVAHRLPIPNVSRRQIRAVIVKFNSREAKDFVFKKRKEFYDPRRNIRLTLMEDLTPENSELYRQVKSNPEVKEVWSLHGSVRGTLKNEKKVTFLPFIDLEQQIRFPGNFIDFYNSKKFAPKGKDMSVQRNNLQGKEAPSNPQGAAALPRTSLRDIATTSASPILSTSIGVSGIQRKEKGPPLIESNSTIDEPMSRGVTNRNGFGLKFT